VTGTPEPNKDTLIKPVGEDERIAANITTACFVAFLADGASLSGQSVLQLDGLQSDGVGFYVYRMGDMVFAAQRLAA